MLRPPSERESRQLPGLVLVLLVLFLTGSAVRAEELSLGERHQPSGLNSRFGFSGKSIADYIDYTRDMISAARLDLRGPDRSRILEGNSAFELKPGAGCPAGRKRPYRRGVVMAHGLTDSPYFMRALGEVFQDRCFRVMAILFPGHGTRPGDLVEVTWQEWAKAVAFGVDALANEVDDVYLFGFSMGGALSIHHSIRDSRIKGLFLAAPAIRITPKGIMANWQEAYSWFKPKAKWIDIMPDGDPYRYESFPANAVDQIHLLTQQLSLELRRLKRYMLPVFIVASKDDSSVRTEAIFDFFKEAIHPLNTLLLYSTQDKLEVPDVSVAKVVLLKSAVPGRRILSSAHTALVLPETDPFYGVNGGYANCLHYFPKALEKYRRCKDRKEDYLGEITGENLKKGVIRRLMYNVKFESLKSHLVGFIERLPRD